MATLACERSVVQLLAELVQKLVRLCGDRQQAGPKASRVKLISMLAAALTLAIHSTVDPATGVNIEGNVPMSDRKGELGHPALLGNLMI
jgi:hypothetical protein